MGLSCSCEFDYGDFDKWWMDHSNFQRMGYRFTSRKRCCSCNSVIDVLDDVIEFYMYRMPTSEIEENIYHEGVPTPSKWMCEDCSGLYLALEELGYCVDIWEPMADQIAEYNEIRGEQDE